MKNNFRPILISLVTLIFLLSIVVFAYRENIWDYLSEEAKDNNTSLSQEINITDAIDLTILQSEVAKSLEKQVTGFDYNNPCVWPGAVVQTSEGFVNRSTKSCSVGTRIPFISENKK